MSEDEDAEEAPSVTLGEDAAVTGAPLARVASRQTWGMARSELVDRVGDVTIRTPEGPQELGPIIEATDLSYFESRQEFESAVRDQIGVGPIPTEETTEE